MGKQPNFLFNLRKPVADQNLYTLLALNPGSPLDIFSVETQSIMIDGSKKDKLVLKCPSWLAIQTGKNTK